jgi:hypothetical protein
MRMLTTRGTVDLTITRPDTASLIGRHWNAVQHFLDSGESDQLDEFRRRRVQGHRFQTEPKEIERLARIGELDIEDIYEEIP